MQEKFKILLLYFQNREEGSGGCTLRKSVYRKGLFHLMNETINPGILSKSQKANNNPFTHSVSTAGRHRPFFSGRCIFFHRLFFFHLS